MTITKILEQTLTAGDTSVQFTDSDIPNSLIRVFCNDPDLIYTSMSLINNTITVTYPAQTVTKYIALEIVKDGLTIIDNVTTDDATKALSAAQGKALNDKIDVLKVQDLDNVTITSVSDGDILVYSSGSWINVAGKNNITDMNDVEVTSLSDGQLLYWDNDEQKFVNRTPSFSFFTPDFSDQIYDSGNITSNYSSYSYTVLSDSWLKANILGAGTGTTAVVYINEVAALGNDNNRLIGFSPIFVKAGDIITLRNVANSTYRIYLYGSR